MMKLLDKKPKDIDIWLRFFSLVAVLLFLHFFYLNMIPFFMHPTVDKTVDPASLLVSLDLSTFYVLIGILVFAALVVLVVFGSGLFLRVGNNELKLDSKLTIDLNHIQPGSGGANKISSPEGSVTIGPTAVQELARDGILSEVTTDGQVVGYITMESFLQGCYNEDCREVNFFFQPLAKDKVYSRTPDRVILGEDLMSVATKMYTQKLSALPVLDSSGRMVGSISYNQALKLLVEQVQKNNNR